MKNKKLKKRSEKLFHKLIIMSKDDMDKFEEEEMKNIRPIIRNWFDQLIKQNMMGKKPKTIRDKLKDKTNNDKKRKKMKNEKIIKDEIITDIRTLSEHEVDYCETKIVSDFWNNNYIEYERVVVIKMETDHL